MVVNTFIHPHDCPDRKEAAANRKTHDAAALTREQRLQILAHAAWFDSGPRHAPAFQPAPGREA